MKACSDPNMFNRPVAGRDSSQNPTTDPALWNGISSETKSPQPGDDWWYEDFCLLSLPLYKRLISSIEAKGMKPENVAASLIYYIRRFVPLMNRQSSFNDKISVSQGTTPNRNSEANQRELLEEILGLLPNKKGVTPSKYLLRLLRTAMILHASPLCIENLEKRIGSQLDQAELVDLLIPNMGYSVETLYDIDCIQRIIDHFMSMYQPATGSTSPCITEEGPLIAGAEALTPMTMVANLVDAYLAEVALDVNLKFAKFQALASAIPDYARPLDDGLYHAIDVYLKLRLRTSISSWLFVADNVENSQNNLGLPRSNDTGQLDPSQGVGNLRERVSELEKECSCIRNELQKLAKTKRSWSIFPRIFFRKNS
ncbi:NPH3 domain [Sesbania bispinosa]|nr:NPH3 domain [Sesbania bispinosa]